MVSTPFTCSGSRLLSPRGLLPWCLTRPLRFWGGLDCGGMLCLIWGFDQSTCATWRIDGHTDMRNGATPFEGRRWQAPEAAAAAGGGASGQSSTEPVSAAGDSGTPLRLPRPGPLGRPSARTRRLRPATCRRSGRPCRHARPRPPPSRHATFGWSISAHAHTIIVPSRRSFQGKRPDGVVKTKS